MSKKYTREETLARRLARKLAGVAWAAPISVVEGGAAPSVTGETHYYTSPGGRVRVQHPRAYARAGNRMVYHASTLTVTVGRAWLAAAMHAAAFLPRAVR